MRFALALTALLACLVAPPAAAQQAAIALRAQLEVEERILAQEVDAYHQARRQQDDAVAAVQEASKALDAGIAKRLLEVDELERLATQRAVAAAAEAILSQRVEDLERRVFDHARRAVMLRQELSRQARGPELADPLSGQWRVEIASPLHAGTFDLRLEGTAVTGTYAFDDGRSGTLKGTFVANRLHLERSDSERGPDGVFEGTVDPEAGVARGLWNPSQLGADGAVGSGWSGVRIPPPPAAEEEKSESG
jgi:hypothetical protein